MAGAKESGHSNVCLKSSMFLNLVKDRLIDIESFSFCGWGNSCSLLSKTRTSVTQRISETMKNV